MPSDLSPPSLIERRIRKPATTATTASTIARAPLTGAPPSALRGTRRGTGPDPSDTSLMRVRLPARRSPYRAAGDAGGGAAVGAGARPAGHAPAPLAVRAAR